MTTPDRATGRVLCYAITTTGIGLPARAELRQAAVDQTGFRVLWLGPLDASGAGRGCLTGLSSTTLDRMVANPGRFAVQVRSAEFGAGAVRGQLGQG